MRRRLLQLVTLVAVFGIGDALTGEARAQDSAELPPNTAVEVVVPAAPPVGIGCVPWRYGTPDLFYNFYVPNNCGGVPAALYVAPYPVPQFVGHTYYTYQPFLPEAAVKATRRSATSRTRPRNCGHFTKLPRAHRAASASKIR